MASSQARNRGSKVPFELANQCHIHLTHLGAVQCGARAASEFKGALDLEARPGSDQG